MAAAEAEKEAAANAAKVGVPRFCCKCLHPVRVSGVFVLSWAYQGFIRIWVFQDSIFSRGSWRVVYDVAPVALAAASTKEFRP